MEKRLLTILSLLFSCCFLLSACALPGLPVSSFTLDVNTQYIAVRTSIYEGSGEVYEFNNEGTRLNKHTMSIDNMGIIAQSPDQTLYVGGYRINTNLIINNREVTLFHLLDKPKTTGSTAAWFDEKYTYVSMNGGADEEFGYRSYLVARDAQSGETLYKQDVPLYVSSITELNGKLYLVGNTFGEQSDIAIITVVNKESGEVLEVTKYTDYIDIRAVVLLHGELFLAVAYGDGMSSKMMKYEKSALKRISDRQFNFFEGLQTDGEFLYLYTQSQIYKMDVDGNIISKNSYNMVPSYPTYLEFQGDNVVVFERELLPGGEYGDILVAHYKKDDFTLIKKVRLELPEMEGVLAFSVPK